MLYGRLAPILNLVNRYDQDPAPRMSKKPLLHEAKINTSPKAPKLDLCVTAAQPWKTPRMSHQRKLYASAHILRYHVVFSRFGAYNTVLSYIKYVTRIKIFPTSIKPNPLISYRFFSNTLPNCSVVTSKIITTLARETTCRLFAFHTDTHNAESSIEHDRRWRSTAFGKSIASEHSEAQLLSISSLTYSLHFTQTLTTLDLTGNHIGDEGARHLNKIGRIIGRTVIW